MMKGFARCMIIIIGCFIFFQIYIYISLTETDMKIIRLTMNFNNTNILVHMKPKNLNDFHHETDTMKEVVIGDRNIFFLETSHIKEKHKITLNSRQACAVESAAQMNPMMKVYLLIFNSESWSYSETTEKIIAQLNSYNNIFIRHISIETYFKNSPMENWWNTTNGVTTSRWFTSHMSDVLRYYTLWKFGGIYLDLDVVVTSSLDQLKNFVGVGDWWEVAAGALGFDLSDTGRRYATECLIELVTNFRGDIWAHNGPGVITRTLKKICNTIFFSRMTPERCHGFNVFPASTFYPIHYSDWELYFDSKNRKDTMKTIQNSLAIHVWNKFSQSRVIEVGSNVPYELIAAEYCPKIYKNCGKTF